MVRELQLLLIFIIKSQKISPLCILKNFNLYFQFLHHVPLNFFSPLIQRSVNLLSSNIIEEMIPILNFPAGIVLSRFRNYFVTETFELSHLLKNCLWIESAHQFDAFFVLKKHHWNKIARQLLLFLNLATHMKIQLPDKLDWVGHNVVLHIFQQYIRIFLSLVVFKRQS